MIRNRGSRHLSQASVLLRTGENHGGHCCQAIFSMDCNNHNLRKWLSKFHTQLNIVKDSGKKVKYKSEI